MNYWIRMAADLAAGAKVALTGPAVAIMLAAIPPYAPIWGVCHWLLKTNQDHGDGPEFLMWAAWKGLGPARTGMRLKQAVKDNLNSKLNSWLMAAGSAACSILLFMMFVQATNDGTLGLEKGHWGNTTAGTISLLGATVMLMAVIVSITCSRIGESEE